MKQVNKVLVKFFKETKVGKGLVSTGVGVVEGFVPGAATFLKANKESELGLTKKGELDKLRLAVALLPLLFILAAGLGFIPQETADLVLEYVTKFLS